MNYKKISVLVLIVLLFFTGCDALGGSVEDMLLAPSLSEEQSQVLTQVKNSAGSDIKLSYPKEGEHKNPIIFYDLTGNGTDEAITFYTKKDEVNVRINICQKVDDSYQTIFDAEGIGNQVAKVQFAHVTHLSYYNLLITWNVFGQDSRFFSLYGFENTQVSTLMTKEGQEVVHSDIDNDLFEELLFISKQEVDGSTGLSVYKNGQNGVVRQLAFAKFGSDMLQYKHITLQRDNATCTIYVDGILKDNRLATQAFLFEKNTLRNVLPATEQSPGLIGATARDNNAIYSADVNADTMVDIPLSAAQAPYGCSYVQWGKIDKGTVLTHSVTTFECPSLKMRFAIPNDLLKETSFDLNLDKMQLSMQNSKGQKMMIIARLSPGDNETSYYSNGYKQLAKSGLYTYVYYIDPTGVAAGLHDKLIQSNFSIIE